MKEEVKEDIIIKVEEPKADVIIKVEDPAPPKKEEVK